MKADFNEVREFELVQTRKNSSLHGFSISRSIQLLRSSKGQAAMEYLMVFGIALILSTPFIMKAQGSIVELRSGSQIMELQSSLDKIESSTETVNAAGPPARRTFTVDVPAIVTGVEMANESSTQDSIIYKYETAEGSSQLTRSFSINLTGNLPREQGKHRVSVTAQENAVNISVVE